jgi:hypothetical protein
VWIGLGLARAREEGGSPYLITDICNTYAIMLTGRRFSKEKLLACAYAFEQTTFAVKQNEEKLLIKSHFGSQ